MDISVMNESSPWNRGQDTILRYSLDRDEYQIKIGRTMGYFTTFNQGGPIAPLDYLSPTYCPFRWDFPILDFKILNEQPFQLFLTEVVLDVEESRIDDEPLLVIRKDTQQRFAGRLLLVNEGPSDIMNLTATFNVVPGKLAEPTTFEPPFAHTVTLPVLTDRAEIDVVKAFQDEGVDIEGLLESMNGEWDETSPDAFVVQKPNGSQERLTDKEVEERWKRCLGRFNDEVGTLIGEISFTTVAHEDRRQKVKFHAPVYLANRNRLGITKPPTFMYDTVFDCHNKKYQRRVQISQAVQSGDADRFTIKVAVAQSSFHRFRATLRDIKGQVFNSLPIEMRCFVPRSRRKVIESAFEKTK